MDIENVEKLLFCLFGNESGLFVINYKNVGRIGFSINIFGYKIVFVLDFFLRVFGKCLFKLSGLFKDFVFVIIMSFGLILSDFEIGVLLIYKGLFN